LLDRVLSGEDDDIPSPRPLKELRLAVPTTVVDDDLSPEVARAFESALSRLSSCGANVIEIPLAEFAQVRNVNPRGALASAEAFSFHQQWIRDAREKYDPRVLSRILPGEEITPEKYRELLQSRQKFIQAINAAARDYDAMLIPTTPDTAPTIAEASKDDKSYFRFNGRMLRNASIVNLFDGCALSIPCREPGSAPVGLMIAGTQNTDRKILSIGFAIEEVLNIFTVQ
jgi:aspartyl-tRNA(Asn)/glutamyl-tRNA(Gln) amidotransferase subunit A